MRKVLFAIAIIFSTSALAQDMHFSQFFATPMFTNPAFTGDFDGTYRFSGVVRNQWWYISAQPYRTYAGAVDFNAPFNIKSLGAGIHIAQDQAGASVLTRQQVNGFLSGRFRLGASKDIIVSGGVLAGFSRQTIDFGALEFDRQYNGLAYDPNLPSGELVPRGNQSWVNLGAGGFIEKRYSKRKTIGAGFSVFNLGTVNSSVNDQQLVRLPSRKNFHVLTSLPFAKRWDVMPAMQYMWQGPHSEFLAGSSLRLHLKQTEMDHQAILLGVWGRPRDAGYVSMGMELNNLFVGGSYDVNLSSLQPATFYRGGWEVTVIYTLKTVREKVKRIRQCPDYI